MASPLMNAEVINQNVAMVITAKATLVIVDPFARVYQPMLANWEEIASNSSASALTTGRTMRIAARGISARDRHPLPQMGSACHLEKRLSDTCSSLNTY